jgi:hypothetical protein
MKQLLTSLETRLRWPLPALLAWGGVWLAFALLQKTGMPEWLALTLACALGVAFSVLGGTWWRRIALALGFPVSLALSGVASLPAWAWLLPLALMLLVYPLNAWRDAPLFPTPTGALKNLAAKAPLQPGDAVLDAGCGLGAGLQALRLAYPPAQHQVSFHGLEWSWALRALCALRCPWARIRQGDIWLADWRPYQLVYLFQRPESMPRAVVKARADLQPGAWMVSLEFEARELKPQATLQTASGKTVWLYRAPFKRR